MTTPHTPLTGEELAAIEARWPLWSSSDASRLIADLRASRAMEASLRMIVSSLTGLVNGYTTDLADSRAEVERLRAENARLQAEANYWANR